MYGMYRIGAVTPSAYLHALTVARVPMRLNTCLNDYM